MAESKGGSILVSLRGEFMDEPFKTKSGKGYLRKFLTHHSNGNKATVMVMADNDHAEALHAEGDVVITLAVSDFGFLRGLEESSSVHAVNE